MSNDKNKIANFNIQIPASPLKTKEGWYYGIYNNYHEYRECIDLIEAYFNQDNPDSREICDRAKWAIKKLANHFGLKFTEGENNESVCGDNNSASS